MRAEGRDIVLEITANDVDVYADGEKNQENTHVWTREDTECVNKLCKQLILVALVNKPIICPSEPVGEDWKKKVGTFSLTRSLRAHSNMSVITHKCLLNSQDSADRLVPLPR